MCRSTVSRIELSVGELACVIACADLVADSTEDVVLVLDAGVLVVIGYDDVTAQSVGRKKSLSELPESRLSQGFR